MFVAEYIHLLFFFAHSKFPSLARQLCHSLSFLHP